MSIRKVPLLAEGIGGIGAVALVGSDPSLIMASIGQSGIGPLAKFSVAFPLIYHTLGGARDLVSCIIFLPTMFLLPVWNRVAVLGQQP